MDNLIQKIKNFGNVDETLKFIKNFKKIQNPEIEYLKYLSASGNPRAQITLAMRYINGIDTEKDLQQGKFYLQLVVAKDISDHIVLLRVGYIYSLLRDYELADKYYKKFADLGVPYHLFILGKIFSEDGFIKDYKQAKKYFELAIEKGCDKSREALKNLLEKMNNNNKRPLQQDEKETEDKSIKIKKE